MRDDVLQEASNRDSFQRGITFYLELAASAGNVGVLQQITLCCTLF